jgi:hypothetical protein
MRFPWSMIVPDERVAPKSLRCQAVPPKQQRVAGGPGRRWIGHERPAAAGEARVSSRG